MTQQKLQLISEWIKDATQKPNADENIHLIIELAVKTLTEERINELVATGQLVPPSQTGGQPKVDLSTPDDKKQGIVVDFTKQEIKQMPNNFKKVYKKDGRNIYAHEHKSGKNTFTWEIRYRRNGYDISVCGKTIEIVKKKFLEKLQHNPNPKGDNVDTIPNTFHSFATYYFENYRSKKVASETYKKDLYRYKRYLQPYFKETPIPKITLAQCQKLINNVVEQGKGKTADELFSLMNVIFQYAKDNHIITQSPNDAVFLPKYQSENGVALTKAEEKEFLAKLKGSKFETCLAIALYTGIRPNEYTSVEIDEKKQFIVAKNSKLKNKRNGEIVYKKIPISPMLRPFIEANPNPTMYTAKYLRKFFKEMMSNHILYDLRTTFYTRCKECHVEEYALKAFMGHSLKSVDRAYTDLSDEYLIAEGNKLCY